MSVDPRYLNGDYHLSHPTFHIEDSPWKAAQIAALMDECGLAPRRIAEIGCGAGEILNQLYQRYPNVDQFTGYEISPQGFALAQEAAARLLGGYSLLVYAR